MSNEDESIELYHQDLDMALQNTIKHYKNKIVAFTPLHYLTRRMASVASFIVLFGILNLLGKMDFLKSLDLSGFSFSICGNSENIGQCVILGHVTLIIIAALCMIFFSKDKSYPKVIVYSYILLNLYSAIVFKPSQIAPYFVSLGGLVFLFSYTSNRKYGYTRAWSRNRLYLTQAEILQSEKKLKIDTDENIRQKLHDLILQSSKDAHRDIVGDYISYGNSALKLLSKNNK